jgi:hypothetical protein
VKHTHCRSFLPFVSASGEVLATYFIFSAKFDEREEAEVTLMLFSSFSCPRFGSVWPKIFYIISRYIKTEVFVKIMDYFADV